MTMKRIKTKLMMKRSKSLQTSKINQAFLECHPSILKEAIFLFQFLFKIIMLNNFVLKLLSNFLLSNIVLVVKVAL